MKRERERERERETERRAREGGRESEWGAGLVAKKRKRDLNRERVGHTWPTAEWIEGPLPRAVLLAGPPLQVVWRERVPFLPFSSFLLPFCVPRSIRLASRDATSKPAALFLTLLASPPTPIRPWLSLSLAHSKPSPSLLLLGSFDKIQFSLLQLLCSRLVDDESISKKLLKRYW
jgi:hypothetical protein